MPWRYIAQRALTGELIDLSLPLKREELRWDLSGPGILSGTVASDYLAGRWVNGRPLLGEWETFLYAELDGRIRWGGIVQRFSDQGANWRVEAKAFSSYANGIPYDRDYQRHVRTDPTARFADLWSWLQTKPDGNLNLIVDTPSVCPVRIGTDDQPYELAWWEMADVGQETSRLAAETPFDYTESHDWVGTTQTISHRLTVNYPRAGRRRADLVFNGDNLASVLPVERDGDRFANEVFVLGKGEGAATLRGYSGVRDGRLRRTAVHTDKMAVTQSRVDAIAGYQRGSRGLSLQLSQITVNDHDNARIGSWQAGDDILPEVELPTVGKFAVWHRVTSWSLGDTDSKAVLTLAPSSSYIYGAVA